MSGVDASRVAAVDPGCLPHASQQWPRFELACRVESYEDGDECTVFPADADDAELTTTWMTADAESYVSIEDSR